jgi:hypothetical protein
MIPFVNTNNMKNRNKDSLFIKWFHPLSEILENNFSLGVPFMKVISEYISSTHYLKKFKLVVPKITKDFIPRYFSHFGLIDVDIRMVKFDSLVGFNFEALKNNRFSISHKIQMLKEELIYCINCKNFDVLILSESPKS